jgi:hypothetical protein
MDKLKEMDLVFFIEFGVVRYVGYITQRGYSASMSEDGKPDRNIVMTGSNIGGLLSAFKMVIDAAIYQGQPSAVTLASNLQKKLASAQDEGAKVGPTILLPIYQSFMGLALKIGESDSAGNSAGIGVRAILDKFVDLETGIPNNFIIKYPMTLSLYQRGENSIWELWQGLAQPPINEMYGRWNPKSAKSSDGGYEIIFRQAPFEPQDWKLLKTNLLPPVVIQEFDLNTSISDVFSFYLCTLPGSVIDRTKAMVMDVELGPGEKKGKLYEIDDEKLRKFGYRPLITEFRFFNRSKIEQFSEAYSLMKEFSRMMKRWYQHNDEMYSGSISIHTINNADWQGTEDKNYSQIQDPKIGERISFLDGEFYVESVDHSWSYMGAMTTRIGVSRGYRYDSSGNMIGKLENVARISLEPDFNKK